MGWLTHHWAGLLGVLLVALQVAAWWITPSGGAHAILMGAAWWALILWGLWYLAARPRVR
jgi:hypothetical protein